MLNFYAIQPVDINHKSKHCKANFYGSKVEELRESDPRSWWKKVLRLSGAKSSCSSHLLAQMHVDELENVSTQKIADAINSTLLEPLEEQWLLNDHAPENLCHCHYLSLHAADVNKILKI